MSIAIPAGLVQNGSGVPAVCSRHGEPASLHKPVKFWSKPPSWAYLLILLGALPFVIVSLVLRKEVQATAWPFCPRCASQHKNRMIIGFSMMATLPLAFVFLSQAGDAGALIVLLAIFVALAGLIIQSRGTYRVLPWGFTSQDGSTVDFPKAHPNFVAAAQAAYAEAAQQYAAWQAAQQAAYHQGAPHQAAGPQHP
jgi:hypothetical protein